MRLPVTLVMIQMAFAVLVICLFAGEIYMDTRPLRSPHTSGLSQGIRCTLALAVMYDAGCASPIPLIARPLRTIAHPNGSRARCLGGATRAFPSGMLGGR